MHTFTNNSVTIFYVTVKNKNKKGLVLSRARCLANVSALVFRCLSENTSLCRYLSQVLTLKTCTLVTKAERHKHCEPHYPLQHNQNIFLSTHSYIFVSVVLQSTAASDALKPNTLFSQQRMSLFSLSQLVFSPLLSFPSNDPAQLSPDDGSTASYVCLKRM